MVNGKSNSRKSLRFIKYFSVIFLCAIIFPSNYSGNRINLKNSSPIPSPTISNVLEKHDPKPTSFVKHASATDEDANNGWVTGKFVLFSILSLLISTIVLALIVGYLNSVSIVKSCILLYLYKDVVTILLLINWIWSAAVVTCYASGNGISIDTSNDIRRASDLMEASVIQ